MGRADAGCGLLPLLFRHHNAEASFSCNAGEDGEESVLTVVTYVHLMKMIVVEYTVIDAFGAGPVLIY